MKRARFPIPLAALALLLLTGGCLTRIAPPETQAVSPGSGSYSDLLAQARRLEEEPWSRKQHLEAIRLYKEALSKRPTAREVLLPLTRLHYRLAWAFSEGLPKDERRALYEQSRAEAWAALREIPELEGQVQQPRDLTPAILKSITREHARELFFLAGSWGRVLQLSGFFRRMADRATLLKLAQRTVELDERLQEGAPHRLLGVMMMEIPASLGGGEKRALAHFQRALELFPENLENRLVHARDYLLATGHMEAAREELRQVRNARVPQDAPFAFEQAVARHLAIHLLQSLPAPPGAGPSSGLQRRGKVENIQGPQASAEPPP